MRFIGILGITLLGVAGAQAGQIRIGGANGLTSSYITSGCSGTGSCIAGSAIGNFGEQNYHSVLFAGASNGASNPTPFVGYSDTVATPSGSTLVDSANGVTFSMISDGLTGGGASKNVWSAASGLAASTNLLEIPIGVFGVTQVWTMLNAELGALTPTRDANVVFTFGGTANATSGLTTITVKLLNSAASSSAGAAGQLRDGVICATGSCPGANGSTLASTVGPTSGTLVPSGVTVLTNNLYNFGYSTATGAYAGTTGSVVLDDQGFIFTGSTLSTALSSYLVSVKVMEPNGATGSGLALSAVTINTTPEPSTVLLVLSGFGVLGLSQLRRKKN